MQKKKNFLVRILLFFFFTNYKDLKESAENHLNDSMQPIHILYVIHVQYCKGKSLDLYIFLNNYCIFLIIFYRL
jgi:hypothetical protein